MKETLYLHIPSYPELWYRQKIMQDPDTMRYNRGYDLPFDGYDKAPAVSRSRRKNGRNGMPILSGRSRSGFMRISPGSPTVRSSGR